MPQSIGEKNFKPPDNARPFEPWMIHDYYPANKGTPKEIEPEEGDQEHE